MDGGVNVTINCPDCSAEYLPALTYNPMGEVLLTAECRRCEKIFSEKTSFAAMIRATTDHFEFRLMPSRVDIRDLEVSGGIH
jgi:hypothetical protein